MKTLLDLVGIGPARERQMRDAGIKSIADLAMATVLEVTKIPGISAELAESLKSQALEIVNPPKAPEASAPIEKAVMALPEPVSDKKEKKKDRKKEKKDKKAKEKEEKSIRKAEKKKDKKSKKEADAPTSDSENKKATKEKKKKKKDEPEPLKKKDKKGDKKEKSEKKKAKKAAKSALKDPLTRPDAVLQSLPAIVLGEKPKKKDGKKKKKK